MPTPEQWQEAQRLFDKIADLELDERERRINTACGGDDTLVGLVRTLLAGDAVSDQVFEPFERGAVREFASLALGTPESIGPYRLVKLLGHGGTSTVFLGVHVETERRYALKLLRDDRPDLLRRFKREQEILATLRHPNIPAWIDSGESGGYPYAVMEYVEGSPITRYCDERRLTIEERLHLFLNVCGAVEFAHSNGIIHRDLKPSNLLVSADGIPMLLDFGIAKLHEGACVDSSNPTTRTGMRWLTPEYAAPEQIRSGEVTLQADIYALGVLLYELACGRRPFVPRKTHIVDLEYAICHEDPPPPSAFDMITPGPGASPTRTAAARGVSVTKLKSRLQSGLDDIILFCLQKDASERYRSVAELASDVSRYLAGERLRATRSLRIRSLRRIFAPVRTASMGAVLVFIAVALAVFRWGPFTTDISRTWSSILGHAADGQPVFTPILPEWERAWSPYAPRPFDVSPRGLLAYSYGRSLHAVLQIADSSGAVLQQIVSDGTLHRFALPRWSPDGRLLAFLAAERQRPNAPRRIFLSSPHEPNFRPIPTDPVRIPAVIDFTWHPDGRTILFSTRDSLYRLTWETGSIEPLSRLPAGSDQVGAVSPDGNWIALHGNSPGVAEPSEKAVWLGRLDAARWTRLTDAPGFDGHPSWLSDDELYFISERGGYRNIWRATLSREESRTLRSIRRVTHFKGAEIVFGTLAQTPRRYYYVLSHQRSTVQLHSRTQNRSVRTVASGFEPMVTPDGRVLLYRTGSGEAGRIVAMEIATGRTWQVAQMDQARSYFPSYSLSPDGENVAFSTRADGGVAIRVARIDGSNDRVVQTLASAQLVYPAWNPDGTALAYVSRHRVSLLDLTTDTVQLIARIEHAEAHSTRWAPSGHFIAVATGSSDEESAVFLVDPKGAPPVRIDIDGAAYNEGLAWHPSGERLLYFSYGKDALLEFDLTKGGTEPAAHFGGDVWGYVGRWSPTGDSLYVAVAEDARTAVYARPAASLETTAALWFGEGSRLPSLSADGTVAAWEVSSEAQQIWALAVRD